MSVSKITPITRSSVLIDPDTGQPTQLFLQIWTTLVALKLTDLSDVVGEPSDGDTLVYDSNAGGWVPQP